MTPGSPQPEATCPKTRGVGARRAARPRASATLAFGLWALGSRRPRRRAAGGFTLIELMIVVTIIGILATISQPMFRNAMAQAREAALRENLYVMRDSIDKFYADNDKYPEGLTDLVEKRYLRRIPKDPITGSAETWQVVNYVDDKGQQGGIIDVRSGSDAIGSDGQRYADW